MPISSRGSLKPKSPAVVLKDLEYEARLMHLPTFERLSTARTRQLSPRSASSNLILVPEEVKPQTPRLPLSARGEDTKENCLLFNHRYRVVQAPSPHEASQYVEGRRKDAPAVRIVTHEAKGVLLGKKNPDRSHNGTSRKDNGNYFSN